MFHIVVTNGCYSFYSHSFNNYLCKNLVKHYFVHIIMMIWWNVICDYSKTVIKKKPPKCLKAGNNSICWFVFTSINFNLVNSPKSLYLKNTDLNFRALDSRLLKGAGRREWGRRFTFACCPMFLEMLSLSEAWKST